MENFFIDDKFYSDLSDLMDEMDIEEENINELPDDWSEKIQLSKLEKMFVLKKSFVVDAINQQTDRWEDRYPEDPSGKLLDEIEKAIESGIDVDKINSLIPELYYPTEEFVTITKQDLIDWVRPTPTKQKLTGLKIGR